MICCYDCLSDCGYNLWKLLYWIWQIFKICILIVLIFIIYVIVDNVVSENFFVSIGTFDLLTVGIAAQRSVRNEVSLF